MSKSISHAVAVILIIMITIASLVIIYVWISSYLRREETEASSAIQALKRLAKIEAYRIFDTGTEYFLTLAIRNLGEEEITINGVMIKNAAGLTYIFTPLRNVSIAPGQVSMVSFPIPKDELLFTKHETLFISVVSAQASSSSIAIKQELFLNAPKLIVYLIHISDVPGHWGDPDEISQALEGKAIVRKIENPDDLDRIIRNPPDGAVIINCHDEIVPIPPSWNNDWYSYFRAIGRNIRDHGWIWVSIMGYPFYYVHNGVSGETIGEKGVSVLLSTGGGSALFWSERYNVYTAEATETARQAEESTGITLPPRLNNAPRQAVFVSGVTPLHVFYEKSIDGKVFYASASYKLGRGYIVISGIGRGESPEIIANVSAATALYTKIATSLIPVESSRINGVYVLAIPDVKSWWSGDYNLLKAPGTSEEYFESATWLSRRVGIKNTYFVNTLDAYRDLVLNPRNRIVVLNMHGELLPLPPDWWVESSSEDPKDYVSSYVFDDIHVSDLHAVAPSTGSASFTLYRDVLSLIEIDEAEALRVSILVAPISPCHSFGVGFTRSTDISNTNTRIFEVEVRLRYNDVSNPIDLVIWHNGTVVEDNILAGILNTHTWYNLTLTIHNNDVVELLVYHENGSLLYSYSAVADPGFEEIQYIAIGLWGVNSGVHDASYLIGGIDISYKTGNTWRYPLSIEGDQILNHFDFNLVSAQGTGPRYRGWIGLIAWSIWRHGWAWCGIKGYPLYYVASNTSFMRIGRAGWQYMKFLLGINPSLLKIRFNGVDAYPTSLATELPISVHPPKWIPGEYAPRPASDFEGVTNIKLYYLNPTHGYTPIFAVKAGNGVFINSGLGEIYTLDHGSMALCLAIAVKELG